jgi:hypothetical protein
MQGNEKQEDQRQYKEQMYNRDAWGWMNLLDEWIGCPPGEETI